MIGQTFGHYRILDKLGAGGMGVVYRARDETLERDVALKVLPAGALADDAARARFRKEALALSQLNHPNICTIYEVGEAGGQSYIAMEYVEGRPLSAMIPGDGLPAEAASRYGSQIAGALAHAHQRGLAHRDLKSSNVMITTDGRAKVLDFGLARRIREAETGEATRTASLEGGAIAGTLAYMAPEVLRGEPADARSDLWALGVMLYEMSTGELPFRGQTGFEISSAILKEAPAPLPPRLPAGLRSIAQRCLAKEPGQRYQRAGEVGAALEAIQSDAAVAVPAPPRPARPRRRLLLGAAALLAVLAAVAVWSGRRERRPAASIEALAVLPLENLSGDPQQEFFADGMTEALIADLAKIKTLRVLSRPSVARFKGQRRPLPEIARDLKVDALVVGSVLRSGDRVRISAQLIVAASEKNLWSETYERDLRDILSLQSEVARAVAAQIRVQLTPEEQKRLAKTRPVNPQAYTEYLRGNFQRNRGSREGREAATALLERAVALDPDFAAGHAALAHAYASRVFFDQPKAMDLQEKAHVAIQKALSLEADSAEAYAARGYLLWTPLSRFAHESAVREYRRALDLNPNQEDVLERLALVYIHVGLSEKALELARRTLEVNPASAWSRFRVAESLLYDGRYEEALANYAEVPRELLPDVRLSQTTLALLWLNRKQEAAAQLEQALQARPPDPAGNLASLRALLAAANGDARRAEQHIQQAAANRGIGHFHHSAHYIAAAYALMNRPQPAVQWLQVAAEEGFPAYPVFERDPSFGKIRSDPGFVAFMTRLKQQWERYKATL